MNGALKVHYKTPITALALPVLEKVSLKVLLQ